MAASITDLFTQATNGTRPSPTTLTAIRAPGAASITVGALTGWPTATAVHFIIYTTDSTGAKVAGSQTDWKGIASGTTISSLVLKAGTDTGNSIGAIVECAPSAAWANDVVAGAIAQHTQLGAHTGITTDTLTATGVVNASAVSSLQDASVALSTYRVDSAFDYVVSGGVWTADSVGVNLNASMTAIVCWINGQRLSIGAVTARAFTLNVDTYIDVLNTAGVGSLVYTTAATNAASPALAANSLRIGIIQAAATITATTKVNQGQEDRVFPIASSIPYAVTDSLGNLICPRDPQRKVLGYRQIIANATSTTAAGSGTDITGLNLNCIIPTGRKAEIVGFVGNGSASVANNAVIMELFDVTAGAIIASSVGATNASGDSASATPMAISSAGGTRNYKARLARGVNAATVNTNSAATNPSYIVVKLA